MKALNIEEIKQFETGDFIYIVEIYEKANFYFVINKINNEYLCLKLNDLGDYAELPFNEYGKKWLAYKNKEQADCKGELVELPLPIDTKVYIIPCYLRNKDITQYKILSYEYCKFSDLAMNLSIVKKQKGLENLVSMSVKDIGNLIFESREEAEQKLKELEQHK